MTDPTTLPPQVRRLLAAAARATQSSTNPLTGAQLRRAALQLREVARLTTDATLAEARFRAREQAAEHRAAGDPARAFAWQQAAENLRKVAESRSV